MGKKLVWALAAAPQHNKSLYTHRCRNIPGRAWIQIPEKRVWRAGISQRTWAVHLESGAGYIPISWTLWKYGRRHCTHRSSPCTGRNAQSCPLGPSPHSEGRRHPGSRWYTRQCGSPLSGICGKKKKKMRLFIQKRLPAQSHQWWNNFNNAGANRFIMISFYCIPLGCRICDCSKSQQQEFYRRIHLHCFQNTLNMELLAFIFSREETDLLCSFHS